MTTRLAGGFLDTKIKKATSNCSSLFSYRQKSNKKLNKGRKEKEVQALGQLVSVS